MCSFLFISGGVFQQRLMDQELAKIPEKQVDPPQPSATSSPLQRRALGKGSPGENDVLP